MTPATQPSKCKQLHDLILSPEILVMPGAHDAFSARLIQEAGFKAIQISGFGVAASMLGLPDLGILSLRDQVFAATCISQAVDIPVMADGDTGFGNAVNAYHTVRMLEAAGAAGVNLEDQAWPKRCGHMDGKQIIPMEEMVQKVRAASKARRDAHFVINARTDALALEGLEGAVRRGNAYAEAGATLIFVEAPRSREDIAHLVKNIHAPISINMLGSPGGKSPALSLAELQDLGVARVSYPSLALSGATAGMRKALAGFRAQGSLEGLDLASFSDLTTIVGLPFHQALEKEVRS
jgi:methylisocitrate lyase